VFVVDLLLWFVTGFSMLTLACSALFVIYFCILTILEILFVALSPEWHVHATRPGAWDVPSTSRTVRPALAAVYKNGGKEPGGIDAVNAAATAGPWGPIDHNLSSETAQKIERIMAIGLGMRDPAGNPCPHPIAPRVALAIVEALQQHQ
jgi:hypothetical protein